MNRNIFICVICQSETMIAPDPPGWAICEDCCSEHEYSYDKWRRGCFCVHCDKERQPE